MCAVSTSLEVAHRRTAKGKLRSIEVDDDDQDRPPAASSTDAPAILPLPPFVYGTLHHLPGAPLVVEGRAADHPAIQCFLGEAFHGGQRDAFVASLEDPFYEPRDRVLVKQGSRILGQTAVAHRVQTWADRRVPVSELRRLAADPEFRGVGIGSRLVAAAEQRMREDGSELAVLSTRIPHYFRRLGYAVCGRTSAWHVSAQQMLAAMPAAVWRSDDHARLTTRPWRQIELPALMRIYRGATEGLNGPVERTEAYWRWLISRQQYDRIYVAIAGRDRCELQKDEADALQSPIVGYAVLREDTVLELLTLPGHQQAAEQLLARAASETIELDRQVVTLHAPPRHALTAALQRAGGLHHYQEHWQGAVTMMKLLAPGRYLNSMRATFFERARAAGLSAPWELAITVEEERYTLCGTRRSVKAIEGSRPGGRRGISLNRADFARLVLGHLDLRTSQTAERIQSTSSKAFDLAAALFPPQPLWTPPWDGLGL
jgi:predicted acetyltransferase